MGIQATYDRETDIAWFRFSGFEGQKAKTEQTEWGLRDADRVTGETVALEFWHASKRLPVELLEHLPSPARAVNASAS